MDRLTAGGDVMFMMAAEAEYGKALRLRIEPVIVGVGPVEAAIGVTAALERRAASNLPPPRLVVSLGSAGAGALDTGSVWQIETVSWRDMDASRLGFEKGVTPFALHPAAIELPTPFAGLNRASLSTGGEVLGGDRLAEIDADLADMETFAVVRACQRFNVPVIGLRGVSDGRNTPAGLEGWTQALELLDQRLADALDGLPQALETLGIT